MHFLWLLIRHHRPVRAGKHKNWLACLFWLSFIVTPACVTLTTRAAWCRSNYREIFHSLPELRTCNVDLYTFTQTWLRFFFNINISHWNNIFLMSSAGLDKHSLQEDSFEHPDRSRKYLEGSEVTHVCLCLCVCVSVCTCLSLLSWTSP